MYRSLDISEADNHHVVFTHPAGFRHLAEAELFPDGPLLVPAAMEVFDSDSELHHHQWDVAGPDCPALYRREGGWRVRGVTLLGEETADRLLAAYTLRAFTPIAASTDFVLAEIRAETPEEQWLQLLFPAELTERYAPGAAVWGAFDRVGSIADLRTEQEVASRHPHLVFRLMLALSRGDKDLWALMVDLGVSSSTVIGAAQIAEQEGYRVEILDGPPMRFRLVEPAYRRTHPDPDSVTGMAGRDVRGIPMDESSYHALLTILERVAATPELMVDAELSGHVDHLLRLTTSAAPRRVLARHRGPGDRLEETGPGAEIDWAGLEDWLAHRPPVSGDMQMILAPDETVDHRVLARLARACQDYALVRVELRDGAGLVVEARKLGFTWAMERILKGFDRASGRRVRLKLRELVAVEYLGLPWYH